MNIKRKYFNVLCGQISEPFVSILLGARQVGKSTLMRQIESFAKELRYRTAFFNLEMPSDLEKFSGSDKEVIQTLKDAGQVIFIDEFHYLKNASKIFKAIYDSDVKIKIFASGSSSMEIHKHLKESLAGRFRKTTIYPLSWDEYNQGVPEPSWDSYCRFGGMPGLLHEKSPENKAELLENIVSTYLTKDIKALIQEENVRAFNSLLYLLAQNQGSLTVVANLARETGMSESTVNRYLDIMSHTYVCQSVSSFSGNLANELKKSRKIYLYDLGIRNVLIKDLSHMNARSDIGTIAESFVLLHLRSQLKPNMEIRFWRTKKGAEVDFVVTKNRKPYPIEVKAQADSSKIPPNLIQFLEAYPSTPEAYVLGSEEEITIKYKKHSVYFKPITAAVDLEFMREV